MTQTHFPYRNRKTPLMKQILLLLVLAVVFASCNHPRKNSASAALPSPQKAMAKVQPTATAGILSGWSDTRRHASPIFKSTDGGQTWDDIGGGLTEDAQVNDLLAQGAKLYARTEGGIYHSKMDLGNFFWEKENVADAQASLAPGSRGMYAFTYDGKFLFRAHGASQWTPVYTDIGIKTVRTVYEHDNGALFIGCDKGLFKSINGGKTWKQVHQGGWVMKIVAHGGVLLATCDEGILRSADNGESWTPTIREGGVGIAVDVIRDGFAAITYNSLSKTRRVRTSYDGGKTWEPIDIGMPASPMISSVVQVGNSLFCGHPDGIFRSTDNGKTWKLIFPSIDEKVFNLTVYGNTVYAVRKEGGC